MSNPNNKQEPKNTFLNIGATLLTIAAFLWVFSTGVYGQPIDPIFSIVFGILGFVFFFISLVMKGDYEK